MSFQKAGKTKYIFSARRSMINFIQRHKKHFYVSVLLYFLAVGRGGGDGAQAD